MWLFLGLSLILYSFVYFKMIRKNTEEWKYTTLLNSIMIGSVFGIFIATITGLILFYKDLLLFMFMWCCSVALSILSLMANVYIFDKQNNSDGEKLKGKANPRQRNKK